jgi:erythromycin esterase
MQRITKEARLGERRRSFTQKIEKISSPLRTGDDLDPLMEAIGDSHYVLLGEASHGTSEYYTWRARLTRHLIIEKGFTFVAVEGDWPDCYQVNRYIKSYPDAAGSAAETLRAFQRWPTWMWGNWEVAAFTEWLRGYNQTSQRRVGFYGLDVYSLWESMDTIINYLEKTDPEAAQAARQAYYCFEPYGQDEQAYAWSTRMVDKDCEGEVVDLLLKTRARAASYDSDPEAALNVEQNATVMVNAERYYRAMVNSDANSWNVRDIHMADTLDRIMDFHGPKARAVVWAHNTHIGDARATDMAAAGMTNLGQLARQRHAQGDVLLVGFGAYQGWVVAGREWGAPLQRLPVPEARPDSWEEILHQAGQTDRLLLLSEVGGDPWFQERRGHRAIGVVYNPEYEKHGNYVPTSLPSRYDAFVFFDKTQALHPLHVPDEEHSPPATYPWGF